MSRSIGEHVRCPNGSLINNRWKVVDEIGCGNFAKVYKCTDAQNPTSSPVAVKILKKEYAADANFENDILKTLNAKDSRGHKVVRKLDSFTWQRCPCFVFALRGPALRACKLGAAKCGVPAHELRAFVKEMLVTLAFLHDDVRMCHTDLKPENILLDEPGAAPAIGIGSGWTIADFGSASFYNPAKPDKDLISTRPYRAPEVVLGLPWSPKADVWSMACIFFEIFHGGRLFDVNDDAVHLAAFEKRITKMPATMSRQSKHFSRFFDTRGDLIRPSTGTHGPQRALRDIVTNDPQLLDLLNGMLAIDPEKRMSARQALHHPYVQQGASASVPSTPTTPADALVEGFAAKLVLTEKENNIAAPAGGKPVMPVIDTRRDSAFSSAAGAPPISARSDATKFGVFAGAGRVPLSAVPAAGKPSGLTPRYAYPTSARLY